MEESLPIPEEIRSRAKQIAATLASTRDYGPLDSSDVGPEFFEELKYRPERPRDRRHAMDSLHVWTTSLVFYAPQGITVFEEVETVSQVRTENTAADSLKGAEEEMAPNERQPDVLHVMVPGRIAGQDMWISLSVFAAPRTENLWNSSGWEYSFSQLAAENAEIGLRETPWGIGVSARYPNQQIEVIGVDGPRWTLRATVSTYEETMNDFSLRLAQDIVESAVVHRGFAPVGPGECLPVGLIDRRNKPPRPCGD